MRRHFGKVLKMGRWNPELIVEPVEAPEIPLLARQCLGGPRVSGVNESHPFQHHEGVHDCAREGSWPDVSAYSAELANERVAGQGLGKEQTSGKVTVARSEWRAYPNAAGMVRHVAGWVGDVVEDKTCFGKKALEPGGKAAAFTTTHACRKPAG
jgi:hypothetical protein